MLEEYRVIWVIDLEAGSAREAAEQARQIQLQPFSTATVFEVMGPEHDWDQGEHDRIDLQLPE